MNLFNGMSDPLIFPEKLENFKYKRRDITHWFGKLRNNNNFYLNFTEWLARPSGTKFSEPINEMSKGEPNYICFFLKSFHTSA